MQMTKEMAGQRRDAIFSIQAKFHRRNRRNKIQLQVSFDSAWFFHEVSSGAAHTIFLNLSLVVEATFSAAVFDQHP